MNPTNLSNPQRLFMESTANVKGFSGQRGSGKTHIGILNLIAKIEPNKRYLVLCPSGIMSATLIAKFWQALDSLAVSYTKVNNKAQINLNNGAVILFRDSFCMDRDEVRGDEFEQSWIDDAEMVPFRVFRNVRMMTKGQLNLTFSPSSFNKWLDEVFTLPVSEVSLVTSSTSDNPSLSASEVLRIQSGLPSSISVSLPPSLKEKFLQQVPTPPKPLPLEETPIGLGMSGTQGKTFQLFYNGRLSQPLSFSATPLQIQQALSFVVHDEQQMAKYYEIPKPVPIQAVFSELGFHCPNYDQPTPNDDFNQTVEDLRQSVVVDFAEAFFVPPDMLGKTLTPPDVNGCELQQTDNPIHDSPKCVNPMVWGSGRGSGCSSEGSGGGRSSGSGTGSGSGSGGFIPPECVDMAKGQDETKAILVEERERQFVLVWDKPSLNPQAVAMADFSEAKTEKQPPIEDDSEVCDTPLYAGSDDSNE